MWPNYIVICSMSFFSFAKLATFILHSLIRLFVHVLFITSLYGCRASVYTAHIFWSINLWIKSCTNTVLCYKTDKSKPSRVIIINPVRTGHPKIAIFTDNYKMLTCKRSLQSSYNCDIRIIMVLSVWSWTVLYRKISRYIKHVILIYPRLHGNNIPHKTSP